MILTGVILYVRSRWPPRDFDTAGAAAWRDFGLTLAFWLLTLALAGGVGRRLLARFAPRDLSRADSLPFSFGLGLAALGYAVLALSLFGSLSKTSVALLMLAVSFWVGRDMEAGVSAFRFLRATPARVWKESGWLGLSICLLSGAIAVLAFLHALSPPTDYDGLMYHLVGPQAIIESGRLLPHPENWFINGPFTIEMIFTLGMVFGDDIFPKLIHFTLSVLLVVATFAAGKRLVGSRGGWLAVAVLLGVPALPVWAGFAYIDAGWSLYEFLAILAILAWWRDRSPRWLALSGIMIGVAMGAKYLGLMGFGVLGIFVMLSSLRRGWTELVRSSLAMGLPAILIASPWYLKNWIWFGNPVFPMYFGAHASSFPGIEDTATYLAAYVDDFGMGNSALDIFMLPWNLYAHHARFSAVTTSIDLPALLFPLLVLYPFIKREWSISVLLTAALARGLVWATGTQQTRFLLPVFPSLAVGTAYVIDRWRPAREARIPWRDLLPMLAVGTMAITFFFQVVLLWQVRPVATIIGFETRGEFLSRTVSDYNATRFALEHSEGNSRVLLLGDGQGYYCLPDCIPDPDHYRWAAEIARRQNDEELAQWFASMGASQIVVSNDDLNFLLHHDPLGHIRAALERLEAWKRSGCLEEAYSDERSSVLRVVCQ
jgi:4-amino-4-deoxy-L-arabinose transferase-like glycosyltransferase